MQFGSKAALGLEPLPLAVKVSVQVSSWRGSRDPHSAHCNLLAAVCSHVKANLGVHAHSAFPLLC